MAENGECDEDCNLLACRYDDGDCDGRESNPKDYKNSRANELFYPSIDFTNILLETELKLHNRNCSLYVIVFFFAVLAAISPVQALSSEELKNSVPCH